jgi:hypothetical protein
MPQLHYKTSQHATSQRAVTIAHCISIPAPSTKQKFSVLDFPTSTMKLLNSYKVPETKAYTNSFQYYSD